MSSASPLPLIDLAYASVEDPGRLLDFLTALADAVGGRAAALVEHDLDQRAEVPAHVRCDPVALADYARYYCRIDPIAKSPRLRAVAVPGEVFVDQMLLSYADLQRTEFHNDWSLKHDCSRVVGLGTALDAQGFAGLAIARAHRDGAFGRDEVATLTAVAPHVRRASELRRLLGRTRQTADAALDVLDRRAIGVVLVDRASRVLHANAEACRILKAQDGLIDDAEGLRASGPAATSRLQGLVADAALTSAGTGVGAGGTVMIGRPSGRRPFEVAVLPAPSHALLSPTRDAAAAVVLVTDPEVAGAPPPERLQQAFTLTEVEAKVAALMARGADAKAISASLRYTRATATWYVKRVLDKAGQPTRAAFAAAVAALGPQPDDAPVA